MWGRWLLGLGGIGTGHADACVHVYYDAIHDLCLAPLETADARLFSCSVAEVRELTGRLFCVCEDEVLSSLRREGIVSGAPRLGIKLSVRGDAWLTRTL